MAIVGKPQLSHKTSTELAVELVEKIAASNEEAKKRKEARRKKREAQTAETPPDAGVTTDEK